MSSNMASQYEYISLNDEFVETFHTSILKFLVFSTDGKTYAYMMFDFFKFEEWLQVPDNESMQDCVARKYGTRGVDLILKLISMV